jgi:hypothetical protein
MAGQLSSFLDGAQIALKIDGKIIAFCEAIDFSDGTNTQFTYGLGASSPLSNEPLMYTGVTCSVRILRYSNEAIKANAGSNVNKSIANLSGNDKRVDGNSLMTLNALSPVKQILDTTFDIEIFPKTDVVNGVVQISPTALFAVRNCYFTNFSIAFQAGQMVSETVSFIGLELIDLRSEIKKSGIGA